ncbi:MAG: glycerol-3-phosphate dehydrogenase/oxidase [Planctomycetaceae bacterium]|nr:glycerol-3-phosphate dehydrogenase/oxidase [Planctomycetaceae bacterium]MBT6157254.1 glycerol-3-phosphate dehydrogenase/oxidase [Planctomycetaceae bacterium]MBT6486776.1 glycerol-3-phosphate dehydrogenase/oxidase [Planctomycetaceae bacterium]MBT6493379.1 glycerol-3-phosphate dehydrogenase/oxidase [Planctomycetaceae bacterium]
MTEEKREPVLILGGGINGAAVARELLLNGVPVCLVEAQDIACGATSRSSRLIHGGLRYLEYGDFALVRESLVERGRLHRLAPQFVSPLRLHIPVSRRSGGWIGSLLRFLGAERWPGMRRFLASQFCAGPRGLWLIRIGLWLYDRFAGDGEFERPRIISMAADGIPQVNSEVYRWQCAYSDGQMLYPERFVVALLEDARQLADEKEIEFRVLTYHRAELQGDAVRLKSILDTEAAAETIQPSLIVNATGAWGDLTLGELNQPSPQLFGGTKGSHFLTRHPQLKAAIGEGGVYAEADDGRPVFVLPFGASVLIGTTDVRFDDRPERAVASADELEYLLELVNDLFPEVGLMADDIDMHYAGVRPLPYRPDDTAAAIPRGHAIEWNEQGAVSVLTLVGGKLTTCRALAEDVVALLAERLRLSPIITSRERIVPGGENYPVDQDSLLHEQQRLAAEFRTELTTIQSIWALCGSGTREALAETRDENDDRIVGCGLPLSFVRRVIAREWVSTLDDLLERRLMLLFDPDLSVEDLQQLADCLENAGRIDPDTAAHAVTASVERLGELFGKRVTLRTPQLTTNDG